MPKPVKKATKKSTTRKPSADPMLHARQMMQEHMEKAGEGEPAAPSFQEQLSAHMSKIGTKGGKIGGKRRLDTMTSEERSAIAFKGAQARWGKKRKRSDGA